MIRTALLTLAGAAAIWLGLAACHYLGVAHAAAAAVATGDPVAAANAATDAGWTLVVEYGPLWGVALLAFGTLQALLRQHWLAQGRALAAITGATMTLGAVLDWRFHGAPSSGIIVTAIMALKLVWSPTSRPAAPPGAATPPSSSSAAAGASVALLVLVVLGLGVVLPGCAARQRGAAAAGAFLDCEAPAIAELLPDLLPLAREAVTAAIAGDGSVDTARLKADAAAIRGDLGRCVLAAAVAAIATPTPAQLNAPQAAELVIDAAQLRGAFAEVRAELDWPEVHVAGTVL